MRGSARGPSPTVRVVLFDLGGLLIELSGIDTFRAWVGDRLTVDEMWRRWLTSPAVRAFEMGHIQPEAFADQLINEFALPVARRELLSSFAAWPRGPNPGAVDLVRRVDRRCSRGMLSNSNILHWPRVLGEFGLGEVFDHHFASHLIGKVKPDLEIFEHVITTLGCEPAEVLFLDDQPLNVGAAREAGIRAFVATGIEQAERILTDHGVLTA